MELNFSENKMSIPNIDLEELKRLKEENFKERLEFIEKYVEWVKKNKNKKWSSEQRNIMD